MDSPIVVCDIKLPIFGGGPPRISEHAADFGNLAEPEGNLLQFSKRLSAPYLRLLTLRSAELVCFSHRGLGKVHGNLGPHAFCLTAESITLVDVGLYTLAQQKLDRIRIGPGHAYKARRELRMALVSPAQVMDVHSWGKMIYSLYLRSSFRPSLGSTIPLAKPQDMPANVWAIVVQCLPEDLNIQVNMQHIVGQLAAIV